jgi:hypothetical protein
MLVAQAIHMQSPSKLAQHFVQMSAGTQTVLTEVFHVLQLGTHHPAISCCSKQTGCGCSITCRHCLGITGLGTWAQALSSQQHSANSLSTMQSTFSWPWHPLRRLDGAHSQSPWYGGVKNSRRCWDPQSDPSVVILAPLDFAASKLNGRNIWVFAVDSPALSAVPAYW